MSLNIKIRNQDFVLHPFGAAYWPEQEVLLVADVHLGKVSHFRKHGSAVPVKAIAENFRKLDILRRDFDPEHIVFLGDLFHSSLNKEWLFFEAWMENISSEVILVEGNHDIISPLKYEALGIKLTPELVLKNFHLTHHPEERPGFFNFSGHIHPGVRINGWARQSLKLPCFFKTENQMILPAFGEFTGKHILNPKEGDEVFVITKEEVICLVGGI